MNELQPCPFCGEAENLHIGDNDIGEPHVYCETCGCGGPAAAETDTDDEAKDRWNDRAFTRSVLEKFVSETYAANEHLERDQRASK